LICVQSGACPIGLSRLESRTGLPDGSLLGDSGLPPRKSGRVGISVEDEADAGGSHRAFETGLCDHALSERKALAKRGSISSRWVAGDAACGGLGYRPDGISPRTRHAVCAELAAHPRHADRRRPAAYGLETRPILR